LVLLDDGWSCERVTAALFVDDETVRRWHQLFLEDGLEGLTRFDGGGSCPRLAEDQEAKLKSWIAATLPRSTRDVGAYIEREFGVVYESRSGLVAIASARARIPQARDDRTQARPGKAAGVQAFIETYENVLNSLGPDEAASAAPTGPRGKPAAIESGGRSRASSARSLETDVPLR
jgi:hypothetical protein